jgi:hypothetical protein
LKDFGSARRSISNCNAKVRDVQQQPDCIALAIPAPRCAKHASRCTSLPRCAEITLHCKSQSDHTEKFGVLLKTLFFFRYDVWDGQAAMIPHVFTPRGIFLIFSF